MTEIGGKKIKKQYVIAACLNLGHFIGGYSVAWTAPVIPKLQDKNQSPLSETISLSQASWIGFSFIISSLIGAYIASKLSNTIGRKPCLLVGGSTLLLGYIVLSLARSYTLILVARCLAGVAVSAVVVTDYVYIGEMASPNIRGIILASTGIFHTLGCLTMYSIGPYISYAATGYLLACICVLHIVGLSFIPESPLFCAMKGKHEEAIKILYQLGRRDNSTQEFKNLMVKESEIRNNNWTWKELVKIKSNRKSLIITVFTCLFQESCGMVAIMFYATTIFQSGFSSIKPEIATIIIGGTQLGTGIIVPLFIEKIGRKTLLMISTAGCFLCMATLSLYFYLSHVKYEPVTHIRWIPLVVMMLSYVSFGFGLNIVPNTFLGEMYRPNVRSIGAALSITLGLISTGISVICFGYIADALGSYVIFLFYSVINMIAFIFVLLVVPETKGMTLKEIEIMLSK